MKRRVSIDDHAAWRESISQPSEEAEQDGIDLRLAERPPAQRPKREVNSLLRVLDQLDQEDATR